AGSKSHPRRSAVGAARGAHGHHGRHPPPHDRPSGARGAGRRVARPGIQRRRRLREVRSAPALPHHRGRRGGVRGRAGVPLAARLRPTADPRPRARQAQRPGGAAEPHRDAAPDARALHHAPGEARMGERGAAPRDRRRPGRARGADPPHRRAEGGSM
ncbi:MAG: hypothetical protein AVDCRST_MAG68-1189, partial [uncultured Gemmatimonadetes bacterium]